MKAQRIDGSKPELTAGRSFHNIRDLRRWVQYEHYNTEGKLTIQVARQTSKEPTWKDEPFGAM